MHNVLLIVSSPHVLNISIHSTIYDAAPPHAALHAVRMSTTLKENMQLIFVVDWISHNFHIIRFIWLYRVIQTDLTIRLKESSRDGVCHQRMGNEYKTHVPPLQLTAVVTTSKATIQMLKSCDFTSGSVTSTITVGVLETMSFSSTRLA